jgi:hypothetical protein
MYVQEQMFRVQVTVAEKNYGVWDSFEGGEVDSDARTYRPGGLEDTVALSAPASTSDVTVSRGFNIERDHSLEKDLINSIGQKITIVKEARTAKVGPPVATLTYNGILKSVRSPTHDSEGERVSRIQLVAAISGLPS